MSEHERGSSTTEPTYRNHPMSVVHEFLNRSPVPNESSIKSATAILAREGNRDALGKCIDLSAGVHDPTLILAEMFGTDDPGLPSRWKEEPEIARTVLSMSAHIELGILEATKLHYAGLGEVLAQRSIEAGIQSLTGFLESLQEK